MGMNANASSDKWWRNITSVLRKSAAYVLLLLFADIIGIALLSILLYRNLFHYFTLVLLGEAGLLFLMGGAADFSGSLTFRRLMDRARGTQKSWSFTHYRQKQMSIAAFVVAAIVLLVLSFALAYPLN